MKRVAAFSNSTFRYTLFGFLFGSLFPVLGMFISIWIRHLPLGLPALIEVQRSQTLLWIIDSAPFFLGLTFGVAGRREDKLTQLKTHLEQTVLERTSELQAEIDGRREYEIQLKGAKEQIEKRAEELQLISEVARALSMEQDIEKLLPLITRLVSEGFGFYHVGIFLIDGARKYAVLKASNSVEGKHMLERGHRLLVGQVGIVGNVAATGLPRIASEVGEDAVFFNNPNLPETHSEIALPLMVKNQIIGVVDAQSKESNAFSQERANTLAILADQIAILIENSRLFSEKEHALIEAQALSRQFNSQAWEQVVKEQHIGYLHTASGEKQLTEPMDWIEAKQAVENGEMVVQSHNREANSEPTLAIPLRIREEIIGVLDIRSSDPNRHWQTEEINIIQAIGDRVGLALENARLFEETTGRANRERTVTEITTRLRSTNDPEIMLRTALDELKRTLGAKDIQIRPYSPPPSEQTNEQQPPLENQEPSKSAEII